MDRQRWYQIKEGMAKDGWKCVVELHPDIPQDVKDSLVKDYEVKYPKLTHHKQIYHNHNAYLCLFVKPRAVARPKVTDNAYRKPIIDRLDAQTGKGIETYGQVISDNKSPLLHRMEETQKEVTDVLVYNEWVMDGLTELARHLAVLKLFMIDAHSKVRGMAPDNPIRYNHEKAQSMIDRLLGEVGQIGKGK